MSKFSVSAFPIQRFTWRQPALFELRIKSEAKLADSYFLIRTFYF